jgi:hypothetical protein
MSRRIVLYSRPGCHLCEELLTALRPLIAGKAEIEVVDIDLEPSLTQRYGLRIPWISSASAASPSRPIP